MSDRKAPILLACATIACIAALYLKQPHIFALPQFYAEEGRFFFADAYNLGWGSLFYTANGYFHLLPRLLANLTLDLGVPLFYIPAVFVFGCLPIYFLLWLKIFTRFGLPAEAKFFMALSTVLVPLGNEIFMNQTNVQWVLALVPVVLYCGDRPQPVWRRILDYVLLVLCLFTGPYVLFLFPVFAVAAFLEKKVKERAVFLTICAVATAACLVSLAQFGSVDRIRGATKATWYGYVQLTFRSYYFPIFSRYVDSVPEWGVIAGVVALPIVMVLIGRRLVRAKNPFPLLAFAAGLLLFASTIVSYGRHPGLPSAFANAIRNFYLPMVLLLWSLLAVTTFDRRRTSAWALLFAWFAVQIPFIPETRDMPDQRWEVYSERLKSGDPMRIPITPAGWSMDLKERRGR